MNTTQVYLVKQKSKKWLLYLAVFMVGFGIGLMTNLGGGKSSDNVIAKVYHERAESEAKVVVELKAKDVVIFERIMKKKSTICTKLDSAKNTPDSCHLQSFISEASQDSISGDSSVLVPMLSVRKARMDLVKLQATEALLLEVTDGYNNRGKIIEAQDNEIINLRGEKQALVEENGDIQKELRREKWKVIGMKVIMVAGAIAVVVI